jgi:uncharacterized protein (TIGR03086 family)
MPGRNRCEARRSAVAPRSAGLELLEFSVGYTLGAAAGSSPSLLRRPTPCAGWDLAALLDHLSDSIEVLREAMSAAGPGAPARHRVAQRDPVPGNDPVERVRGQAMRLLAACAALGACAAPGPPGRTFAIGDRVLTPRMVTLLGVIEIAVHGWDISVACGACRPVPPGLALIVLPLAPLLVTPDIRPGLFADPVPLAGPACPGDQLVAFLGRQPRLAGTKPVRSGH